MNREKDIDIAKGIGISLVVLDHAYPIANPLNNWICSFHMPLFLIISGMLYAIRENKDGSLQFHLPRKIQTIVIPYFIWATVHKLVIIGLQVLGGTAFMDVFPAAIRSILTFGSGPTWFLPTLLGAEILFFLFSSSPIRIGAALLLCAVGFFAPKTSPYAHIPLRTFLSFGYLTAGYYLYPLFKKYISTRILIPCTLLSIGFGIANGDVFLSSVNLGNPIVFLITSFLGTYLVLRLSQRLSAQKSFMISLLSWFGENSIMILCLHDIVLEILRLADAKTLFLLAEPTIFNGFVLALLTLICHVPLVFLCNRYLYWSFGKKKPLTPAK